VVELGDRRGGLLFFLGLDLLLLLGNGLTGTIHGFHRQFHQLIGHLLVPAFARRTLSEVRTHQHGTPVRAEDDCDAVTKRAL
jgi:hypothetical protein